MNLGNKMDWFRRLLGIKRLQNEDQNVAVGPWETLPRDIMEKIALHLNSTDYVRSSLVCKSWRFLLLQSDLLRPQVPWLLIPDHSSSPYLRFFNFMEAKYHRFAPPEGLDEGRVVGSSKGWLIIMLKRTTSMFDVSLFNPISGAKHCLPSLPTTLYLQRIELSSSNIFCCTVAAIVDNFEKLALCKLGDERWEIILPLISSQIRQGCRLVDILFCRLKLHVLTDSQIFGKGKIEKLVMKLPNCSETMTITLIHDSCYKKSAFFDINWLPPSDGCGVFVIHGRISYLVESIKGRVMLIHKHHSSCYVQQDEDDEYEDIETENEEDDGEDESSNIDGFRIYEIREDLEVKKRVCKQRGLGKDQAVFLSDQTRLCLPVTKNLQGNCINFVMDYSNDVDDDEDSYLININGIYHLHDYTIDPLIPNFEYSWSPEFMWFVPNLQL